MTITNTKDQLADNEYKCQTCGCINRVEVEEEVEEETYDINANSPFGYTFDEWAEFLESWDLDVIENMEVGVKTLACLVSQVRKKKTRESIRMNSTEQLKLQKKLIKR